MEGHFSWPFFLTSESSNTPLFSSLAIHVFLLYPLPAPHGAAWGSALLWASVCHTLLPCHKRDKRRKEGRRGERWRQSIVFPPRRSDPAIALMTEERTLERQGLWKSPPFRGGAWWKGGNRVPLWCFWWSLLSSHQTACILGQAWGAEHGARREFG